ncbi:periodic tryptophan protein 1-like protein [Cucumis melo var. makuwa]|uniref:Periodic tryptophan protein 1-like protein n=1 Tax=Cucumis melo var. makuwa TaxID=1194695 RepID=A0A5D3DXH3_CUCMM|nr:periodic tryptophan protein 1-like protein [Cucumis melo var. makuwa]TYK28403.1 periodic tryptophan protein 1-like protein [Cucumis melo var. makuwa]
MRSTKRAHVCGVCSCFLHRSDFEDSLSRLHNSLNIVQVSLEDGTVKGFHIRNPTTETSSESKASSTLHAMRIRKLCASSLTIPWHQAYMLFFSSVSSPPPYMLPTYSDF